MSAGLARGCLTDALRFTEIVCPWCCCTPSAPSVYPAVEAANLATQIEGGYGFIEESAASRHHQDARILTIGEGTSEVQRMLIARSLGLSV